MARFAAEDEAQRRSLRTPLELDGAVLGVGTMEETAEESRPDEPPDRERLLHV